MRKQKLTIFHVICPLLLGGFIYISFRTKSLVLFNWIEDISLSGVVNVIRNIFYPLKSIVPNWIVFSLPDGLWTYAFTSSLLIIWNNINNKVLIAFIPLLIGVILELLQYLKINSGTFDLMDIATYIIAATLSILIFKLKFQDYENKIS